MSTYRITTNGMFRNYRSNLYKNNGKLQKAMTGVQTERKFNTYAEDPAAASKAWRLRRSYWLNEDQIDNTQYVISKFESASQAMHSIVDGDAGNGEYGLNGILASIKGLSDSSGASRTALGKDLIQTAENMVAVMNSKYGEDFVFAGADGANVPFTWDADKNLLYRGVRVDLEKPKELSDFGLKETDIYGLTADELTLTAPEAPTAPTAPGAFSETAPTVPAKPAGMSDEDYNAALNDYHAALDKYYYPYQTQEAKDAMTDEEKTLYTFAQDVLSYVNDKKDYDAKLKEYQDIVAQYDAAKEKYDAQKEQYDLDKAAYDEKLAAANAKLDEAQPGLDMEKLLTEPKREDYGDDTEYARAKNVYDGIQNLRKYATEYKEEYGVSFEDGAEQYEKLEKMANETTYVDIGLGMEEKDGKLIEGSAFNSAVSGLKFLGYGKDKNLAMIVRELGEIYARSDNDTGAYANAEDNERADELLNMLHSAVQASQDQHVQLEADAKYLNTNLAQLTKNKDQLNTQINDTERMDMAEAITEMTWAQYCYNAALRIGTNILSQSLIDYMG